MSIKVIKDEEAQRRKKEFSAEEKAISDIKKMALKNAESLRLLWSRGNGFGGGILDMIASEIGRTTSSSLVRKAQKQIIPSSLRTRVFERDAYRCVFCNSHIDLTVDHIIPECNGGTIDFDNLQTLCRPCNSSKGSSQ